MSSTTPHARLAHTTACRGRLHGSGFPGAVSRWPGLLRLQTPAENRIGFSR